MSRNETLGRRFGKTDLDRVGFFDDPNPGPFDVYRGPVEFREAVVKGRQILPGPAASLFEKKFTRLFEKEALTEPWRREAQERLQREKGQVAGTMKPASGSKIHSTPGDWYGCFDKPTHFSPELRIQGRIQHEPPNMKIKPNPIGGPGYANICLSPFPSYSYDPYNRKEGKPEPAPKFLTATAPLDYFPPNPYEDKVLAPTYVRPEEARSKIRPPGRFYVPFPKKPGGNHDGCFNKFPQYSSDPYIKAKEKIVAQKDFVTGGPSIRSKYTNSIIEQVTRRSCNINNYIDYENRVYRSAN